MVDRLTATGGIMDKSASVQFFLRFLKERFVAFKHQLNAFLKTLALEDRNQKLAAAKSVLSTLEDLKNSMSQHDRPNWISVIEEKFRWFITVTPGGNSDAGLQVLQCIMSQYQQIESQNWENSISRESTSAAIDFSAIYEEYYKTSRVPELFDELVGHLEQIVASGEIDSIQTIKSLEKLIATIKKNSRGDLFSTRGAWEFVQLFFKNTTIEILEDLPVFKHVFKAARKTMTELDLEMEQVHDQIKSKISDLSKVNLPLLNYKPLSLPKPTEDKTH